MSCLIRISIFIVAASMTLTTTAVLAQSAIQFGPPVNCTVGEDCWIVNLVDGDPGPGAKDYLCQGHTYDGHKGTDFAIRDLDVMSKGVRVQAAANGVVRGVRDGVEDVDVSIAGAASVKGKECGNGVVLVHGDGWETQYCHLRKGSVGVKSGDRVKKGQYLGFVGHSGLAAFPHVHFQVRYNNQTLDPFVGFRPGGTCTLSKSHLWDPSLVPSYTRPLTSIYGAGFADTAPKFDAVKKGYHHDSSLLKNAPALVLWAAIYNVREGDVVSMRITSPDGSELHAYENTMPKTQARRFLFSGKKRKPVVWPQGTYEGEITLTRTLSDGRKQVIQARRQVLIH